MTVSEVRKKFLDFYKKNGHAIIPSALLVPENDPTTLFTGSGMQPLVPYLLGQKHPQGDKLANSQKSFRSGDIEDIGDNRHTTFFEMLGNWSLGNYFKKEQLPWFFKFLTDEIGIDPKNLYVTVFIGDKENNIPIDADAASIWKELFKEKGIDAKDVEIGSEENGYKVGMQGGRIFYYDAKKNWWSRSGVPANMPAGEPGGPDSEVFYDFGTKHDTKYGEQCHPNCDCGRFLEIGNSVFMEYKKTEKGFEKLPQKNVDFGGGLERISAVSENKSDVFLIDVFEGTIKTLEKLSGKTYTDTKYTAAFRIIADHLRSSIFLIGDGVIPSNSDQGYFVRRLLRRAVRYWDLLGIKEAGLSSLVDPILAYYKTAYPETVAKSALIKDEIAKEEEKFRKTLAVGIKQFEKAEWMGVPDEQLNHNTDKTVAISGHAAKVLPGEIAFDLFQTYGFPFELTQELAKEKGIIVSKADFDRKMSEHQDLSRSGSEKKFKGGLGSTGVQETRYHTATHLLNAALREVLGKHVMQKGSNITAERMRFDFSHPNKMTDEEKKKVEDLVNKKIQEALPVVCQEMPKEEAEKTGAVHAFGDKYGDMVKVYTMGNEKKGIFSREFCGGPHVDNTSELGHFKIQKEEAVSAGVRRIKAVLE